MDLLGTGLLKSYQELVEEEIGKEVSQFLYDSAKLVLVHKKSSDRSSAMRIYITASPMLWGVCKSIIMLWYYGEWTSMTAVWYRYYARMNPNDGITPGKTIVPSAAAYTQQLSYRAAGAHPPGAHPTGFGSWGLEPVFGDFTTEKKAIS